MKNPDFRLDETEDRAASIVATLSNIPDCLEQELGGFAGSLDWLYVRGEKCGDLDPDWLRGHFDGQLIYSLGRGGPEEISSASRLDRIGWAVSLYDLIELQAPHDLTPELLNRVPWHKRLITWCGQADEPAVFSLQFEKMSQVRARFYRLVATESDTAQALAPLSFLAGLRRKDVIAYATGAGGLWSRLLAPFFGCPLVFASLRKDPENEGIPSVLQLICDYGLPQLHRPKELYGIVGNPVLQSKSPRMHNAAYRAQGRAALYLPFQTSSFAAFWNQIAVNRFFEDHDMAFQGFTVVSPNKEAVEGFVIDSSDISRRSLSCNVLHRVHDGWRRATTDPQSVLSSLKSRGVDLREIQVAVVGCGGAGRAIAAALDFAGAHVTLVNRGAERGELAQKLLGLPFVSLDAFGSTDFDVVVHATPLGRNASDPLPFSPDKLRNGAVLVELVYGPVPTRLAAQAGAQGVEIIDGHEILSLQVAKQFEIMTGAPWQYPEQAIGGPRYDTVA